VGGERQDGKPAGHDGAVRALRGQESREAPGPFPVRVRGMPCSRAEAWKRMGSRVILAVG